MIDVRIGRRKAKLPTSWADCVARPAWLLLALEMISTPKPALDLKVEFALRILKIRRWQWWRVAPEIGVQLAEQVAFITSAPAPLSENLVTKLGHLHYTPHPWRDLRTWEYARAEKFFRQVTDEAHPEALDGLAAVLFRPRRWGWWWRKGDRRIAFRDEDLPARMSIVAQQPIALKMAFWLHFLHFRSEIVQAHPHLHRPRGDAKNDNEMSWADTIISLSTPGHEDVTADSLLAYTLRRLEMEAARNEKLNEQNKSNEDN